MASYLIEASFLDSAHELPKDTARKVWKALSLLSKNPSHPGLHLEAVHGKAEGLHSVRVDDQYRIILQPDENMPRLLYVGPHDKAYQFAERGPVIVPVEAEVPLVDEPEPAYSLASAAPSRPLVIPDNTVKELLLRTVKYLPLASFLVTRAMFDKSVQVTFSKIEEVIRSSLPAAARRYRAWWANEAGRTQHVQAHAWVAVGWKVKGVDFDDQQVVFVREAGGLGSGSSRKGKDNMEIDRMLADFDKRLTNAGTREKSREVHIKRVSTYLNWCQSDGHSPLQEATREAFLESRKTRGCKLTTIVAYSESTRTFLRFMCS